MGVYLLMGNCRSIHFQLQEVENKSSIFYADNFRDWIDCCVARVKTDCVLNQNVQPPDRVETDVACGSCKCHRDFALHQVIEL